MEEDLEHKARSIPDTSRIGREKRFPNKDVRTNENDKRTDGPCRAKDK